MVAVNQIAITHIVQTDYVTTTITTNNTNSAESMNALNQTVHVRSRLEDYVRNTTTRLDRHNYIYIYILSVTVP